MADAGILDRVAKVTSKVLNVDAALIKPESNFVFDLGAESTQSIQLMAAFEDEFGVELSEEAALAVQTVGEAAEFIKKYLK